MARLRPTLTLCAVLGCLALVGCGQAGVEADSNDQAEETRSEPSAMSPGAADETALTGTAGDDNLRAGGGDDVVRGLEGDDEIYGGEGKDRLYGGPGDDVIDAQDPDSVGAAGRDEISCGPGRDEVLMDANDGEEPRDCETATVGTS